MKLFKKKKIKRLDVVNIGKGDILVVTTREQYTEREKAILDEKLFEHLQRSGISRKDVMVWILKAEERLTVWRTKDSENK